MAHDPTLIHLRPCEGKPSRIPIKPYFHRANVKGTSISSHQSTLKMKRCGDMNDHVMPIKGGKRPTRRLPDLR